MNRDQAEAHAQSILDDMGKSRLWTIKLTSERTGGVEVFHGRIMRTIVDKTLVMSRSPVDKTCLVVSVGGGETLIATGSTPMSAWQAFLLDEKIRFAALEAQYKAAKSFHTIVSRPDLTSPLLNPLREYNTNLRFDRVPPLSFEVFLRELEYWRISANKPAFDITTPEGVAEALTALKADPVGFDDCIDPPE